MPLLSQSELRRLEKVHAEGISSQAVVKIFTHAGERFSEATLRKYVQLGLLPTSRRVGIAGRQRGSSGLYPVIILRQANAIKRALAEGHSLETLRSSAFAAAADVEGLKSRTHAVVTSLHEAIDHTLASKERGAAKKALNGRKKAISRELDSLSKIAARLNKRRAP